MKCIIGENVILRGIFHVVSYFPQHFMLYCGSLDCFSNRVLYSISFVPLRWKYLRKPWSAIYWPFYATPKSHIGPFSHLPGCIYKNNVEKVLQGPNASMTTFAFPSMTYILYIAGMLERGEIDVALADLSLTFPRAQVK